MRLIKNHDIIQVIWVLLLNYDSESYFITFSTYWKLLIKIRMIFALGVDWRDNGIKSVCFWLFWGENGVFNSSVMINSVI
jgi:hypothetical protein